MRVRHVVAICLYFGFVAVISFACYRRPVADDFDRYIYEAIVRGRHDTVETIYPIIKHSNKRAEESSIMDSPIHLGQLEPMYAIKPLYIKAIEATEFTGLTIQNRINLISALSLFGVGTLLLAWTRKPGYSALLVASTAVTGVFRMGTPDGLSTLVVLAGLWAVSRSWLTIGILLLMVSVWIRTDNLLLVVALLGYLCWQRRLSPTDAAVMSLISITSVGTINHFSGNYNWRVLFQFSFLGGKSPAEIVPHFGVVQYIGVATRSAETIVPQIAIWVLLAIIAWKVNPSSSRFLVPVWVAVAAHYVLYPSPESRYLVWALLVTGIIFVEALEHPRLIRQRG